MEKWDDLKPDMKFLKFRLEAFRLSIVRDRDPDQSDLQKRMELELELLQLHTQEKLIDTMEKSIKSQDNFSKTANFIGFAAIILAAAQIFIALILATRA